MTIASDPYSQGLDRRVAIRLATLRKSQAPDPKDRAKYEQTPHFQKLREAVEALYKTCVVCGRTEGLVVHHRSYRDLFREDVHLDVTLLCRRHHRRAHNR